MLNLSFRALNGDSDSPVRYSNGIQRHSARVSYQNLFGICYMKQKVEWLTDTIEIIVRLFKL